MKAVVSLLLICGALAGPVQDDAIKEFATGNHIFTASVYKELLKTKSGNFVSSPLSVETVLALTNEGAQGKTSSELVTGLSLPHSKQTIRNAFQSILPKLKKSEEHLNLQSANRIYVGKGLELDENFKSIATTIYDSGVDNVDFERNTETASDINSWVESKTNNKIRNLIKPSDITADTRMILVNALYFSGKWDSPFETYFTLKKKFYRRKDDSVEVETMQQVDNFNYYENQDLNAKFLELPYRGGDISMVIVLPNEVEGLASLEQNVDKLFAPQPFRNEKVKVELPKFTIETEIKFVPILQSLGVRKIFSQNADLSGLSTTDRSLYVTDVIQKAFINVTESGTEAAAATSVGVALLSAPIAPRPVVYFVANHPFTYYIRDNLSGVILFFGRFNP